MAPLALLRAVLALAAKDLRLTLRNKGALFFSFVWPVVLVLFFGLIFGGIGGGKRGRIPIAVVDEDGTPASGRLVASLAGTEGLDPVGMTRAEGEAAVRAGKRVAAVVVPRGYGAATERPFGGDPARLEIETDPSRTAEAAMLEGILTGAAMKAFQVLFTDRQRSESMLETALADLEKGPAGPERDATRRFLGELRRFNARPSSAAPAPGAEGSGGWRPVAIERRALRVERAGPESAFDVTFPQGVLWGIVGSALGFALSLVTERTHGTLTRLQMSPLARGHVLAAKALACFATLALVEALLFTLGPLFFGVRPASWPLLVAAALSVDVCFVGMMMLVSCAGRTEQTVGGLGWAIMLPLMMLGGGMVPLFAMPAWMQAAGTVSPVRWGILALEGAIWRGFGPAEMVLPCGILLAVGGVTFAVGAWLFGRAS
jgi:ABC-2 type transport system permease protein